MVDRRRHDAERDVARVEHVVGQRREWIFSDRRPMHERYWAERWFADRSARERESGVPADRPPPDRRKLHHDIMRMLAIDERPAIERFADLEDLGVAALARRERIEAEHVVEPQIGRTDLSALHPHPPVWRAKFVRAARTALMVEHTEDHAVLHELPARRRLLRAGEPNAGAQEGHEDRRDVSTQLSLQFRMSRSLSFWPRARDGGL